MKNVLFLLVDCLRADRCYGIKGTAKTSTINLLRQKGTTFLNTISAGSFTLSSIPSLLTGTYPFLHGIEGRHGLLNPNIKTLAEVFKENGYNTYAEMTGPLSLKLGLDRGFDHYEFREGWLSANDLYSRWGKSFIQRMKNGEFSEPWFLFVHLFELHLRGGGRKITEEFNKKDFGRNKYDRALSCFDAHLGEMLEKIDYDNTVLVLSADHGEKIAENVFQEYYSRLFLFLSEYCYKYYLPRAFLNKLNRNRRIYKPIGHAFHIYDILVKVPLIFVDTEVFPENKVISDQVRQVDIFPTIVDALKLNTDDGLNIHGRSLMPLIMGEKLEEIPAYIQSARASRWMTQINKRGVVGIRTSKYKFAYAPYNDKISPELYDLENDPEERRNIAKEKPEVAQALRQRLLTIQSEDLGIKWPTLTTQKMSEEEEKIMKERLEKLGYL